MHFQLYSYIMQYIENNIIKYVEYTIYVIYRQILNLKTFSNLYCIFLNTITAPYETINYQ